MNATFIGLFTYYGSNSYKFTRIIYYITPKFFYFILFFTLGLIARANTTFFIRILNHYGLKITFCAIIIIVWAAHELGYIPEDYFNDIAYGGYFIPFGYFLGIITLLLVVQIFYHLRFYFDKETKLSKTIRFIGRRTLDIYFIHYFLLPDLSFMKPFFSNYGGISIDLVFGFIVAIIISALALLIGSLIRMSPLLAEWLLGVKRKKKEAKTLKKGQPELTYDKIE